MQLLQGFLRLQMVRSSCGGPGSLQARGKQDRGGAAAEEHFDAGLADADSGTREHDTLAWTTEKSVSVRRYHPLPANTCPPK